ncbi:MAG: cytochrome c3 family protein [Candidatus Omnitrophica bacterium]|nr:cytochrome c3 family protein [Candidatus Omnitrophota bacterium]
MLLVGLAVLVGAALYAARERARQAPLVVQPSIPFPHKTHVDAGLTCTTCHATADSQSFAGLPAVRDCLDCHAAVGADTPLLAQVTPQLEQAASRKEELPWKQVYQVPAHVYFSHQRHVTLARLDCEVCHGQVKKLTSPVVRQDVAISMERCVTCHQQQRVTADCLACHR